MKFLKKIIFTLNLWLVFTAGKVFGQSALERVERANTEANLPSTEASAQRIIINFINYALTFVGLFFLISIIYAGWQWLSSAGESDKIEAAKKRLKNTLIGITIIASSLVIVIYVDNVMQRSAGEGGYYDFPGGRGNPDGSCQNNLGCLRDFGSDWICQNNSCVYAGACDIDADCAGRYGDTYICKRGPIKKECCERQGPASRECKD